MIAASRDTPVASPTESVDRALRRLRPVVALALLVYVIVRADDSPAGNASVLAMAICSIGLLALGRVTDRIRRAGGRSERVADAVTVAIDGFVTVLAITRLDVLDPEIAWALLLIPVLEGALRFRMRGVVTVWCGITATYVAMQLRIPSDLADPLTQAAFLEQIQTLVYRSGIVLLVATPAGYLSDQLLRAIAAQRLVHLAAAERSSVLVGVVDAGRSIGRSGIDLPAAVVGAALDLGFSEAEWLVHDARAGWTVHRRATTTARETTTHAGGGDRFGALAAAVAEQRVTLRSGRDDPDPLVAAELDLAGLEEVVALPVRAGSDGVAVLRVSTRAGTRPSVQQIEGVELLAAQAAVAGDNAQLLSDLDAAHSDLEHQATHDGLTGLANRTLFHRTLDQNLEDLAHAPGPLSVLFLDLDRFKAVNDRLGHDVGDELLVAVSQRLSSLIRSSALCARLGGDEFIIVSPSCPTEEAETLAGRIVDRLGQPFRLSGHTVEVGASVGVVVTAEPMDADELIRRGDVAMYQAKHGGRSTWCVYTAALDADGREDARIEAALRQAIDDDQLALDYQPIVALHDDALVGVEARLRWTHPSEGVIPASRFVGVAERAGLADDLGAFRLGAAIAQAGHWQRGIPGDQFLVTIPIGSGQIHRSDFVATVLSALERNAVHPGRIQLAVAERDGGDPTLRPVLDALRRAGLRIAIDGFGSGGTSADRLAEIPIDAVRLAPELVAGIATAPRRRVVAKAVIRLGHELGCRVVAPGVASNDDADVLRTLGCDEIEGAVVGPPAPAFEIEPALRRRRRPDVSFTGAAPAAGVRSEF